MWNTLVAEHSAVKQRASHSTQLFQNCLTIFCNLATITLSSDPQKFTSLLPFVSFALSDFENSYSRILEYLFLFVETFTNEVDEHVLLSQKHLVTPLIGFIVTCFAYHEDTILKMAIAITINITSLNDEFYVDVLDHNDLLWAVENSIQTCDFDCATVGVLQLLSNIFAGKSALKLKLLNSKIVMSAVVDCFVSFDFFAFEAMTCLKSLFKGPFDIAVTQFFQNNNHVLNAVVIHLDSCTHPKHQRGLKQLLCDLLELDAMIFRTPSFGKRIVDEDKLQNDAGFIRACGRIEERALMQQDEDLLEILGNLKEAISIK